MPARLPGITVVSGEYAEASSIMTEASLWLIDRGEPQWMPHQVSEQALRDRCAPESVLVGRVANEGVAAVLLEWSDERCWPGVANAGFIHRLAIRRAWAAKGYAEALLENAAGRAAAARKISLNLDCLAERSSLCAFYERCGFQRVGSINVAGYQLALYTRAIH